MKVIGAIFTCFALLWTAAPAHAQASRADAVAACSAQAAKEGASGDLSFMERCLKKAGIQAASGSTYRTTTPDASVTKQLRDSSDSRNDR